jgi:hypothetical protein
VTEQHRFVRIDQAGVLTLILLIFISILIVLSLGYPSRAGQTPLAIGIPTWIFLFIESLSRLFPGFEKRFGAIGEASLFTGELAPMASEGDSGKGSLPWREALLFFWLSGLLLATYLLGIMLAMPLFVLAYLRYWSRESWRLAIIYGVSTWVLIYLFFVKLLEMQRFPGAILQWLGY